MQSKPICKGKLLLQPGGSLFYRARNDFALQSQNQVQQVATQSDFSCSHHVEVGCHLVAEMRTTFKRQYLEKIKGSCTFWCILDVHMILNY